MFHALGTGSFFSIRAKRLTTMRFERCGEPVPVREETVIIELWELTTGTGDFLVVEWFYNNT